MGKFAKWKSTLPIGLAAGISALVIMGLWASQSRFETVTIRAFQEHQLTIARSIAASVEEIFDEVKQDVHYIARDHDVVDVSEEVQDEIQSFFESHSQNFAASCQLT